MKINIETPLEKTSPNHEPGRHPVKVIDSNREKPINATQVFKILLFCR